jgi:hypothetical protein
VALLVGAFLPDVALALIEYTPKQDAGGTLKTVVTMMDWPGFKAMRL